MAAAPNGSSIFPLIFPTQPVPAEFNQDNIAQLLALINQQCAPAASGITPGSQGTFTMNGATPVTVVAPSVTANSAFTFGLKTVGGTVGAVPSVKTVTPGTGFTVAGTAADTSVYNYGVIG